MRDVRRIGMAVDIQAIGIDIGSSSTKLVGTDSAGQMIWHVLEKTEPRIEEQVRRMLDQAWEVNEGGFNVHVKFSDGTFTLD